MFSIEGQNWYGAGIPKEVKFIISELKKNGFKAHIVGGCVRDFLRNIIPTDWDVATDAMPKEIQKIFPQNFYANKFFTVTVQIPSPDPRLREIEITTYRLEAKYTDKRHPDEIKFAKTVEEDLARRDFTINAIALDLKSEIPSTKSQTNSKFKTTAHIHMGWAPPLHTGAVVQNSKFTIIDPFNGQKDLEARIIRAVGNPDDRFNEDALRPMRAVRFAVTLGEGWKIEEKTARAIKKNASHIQVISNERVRDELVKIIMSERAKEGIEMMRSFELLKYIIPELEEGYGVSQNKHHLYPCWEHYLKSLEYAAKRDFNKYVRFAALFHDVGKPRVKQGEGPAATFYNHEVVGAKITSQTLERLRFSKKDRDKIVKLVRHHLFYYNPEEVGNSSVRRLVRQAGPENMEELLQVRMCDRIGSGCPKAEPYKLRHLKYVIEKVSQDPISVKMLKVNGNDVMEILKLQPGPKVGQILDVLLSYVLEDPEKNKKEFLKKEAGKLGKLPEKELSSLAQKAREEREKMEIKQDEMTKKKYWVT